MVVAEVEDRHRVLKTKVIYEANAAGKSNLIMALSQSQRAVLLSGYDDGSALESFEVRLLVNDTPYRY